MSCSVVIKRNKFTIVFIVFKFSVGVLNLH